MWKQLCDKKTIKLMKIQYPYNELVSSGDTVILDNRDFIVLSILNESSPEERSLLHQSHEGYFALHHSFVHNKHMNETLKRKLDRM